MTLYQEFKKLNINHYAVELDPHGMKGTYFCTPKGARIIGSAGVDGIHYCFVRGQEEMVFAISPMNTPGSNVHLIARTFADLLRLLLACGSLSALEQAHQWDEEQFEEYVAGNQATDEALAVFDVLKEKLGITPMEEPYAYLRDLQDTWHGKGLIFPKEYDGILRSIPVDDTPSAWKVTLDGGFQPARGKPGKEITIGRQFLWGDERWHVPAVYLFSGGLVLDLCIQVHTDRVKACFQHCKLLEEQDTRPSEEEACRIRNESPTNVDFQPTLILNGEVLRNTHGHGHTWISSEIIMDDAWEDRCGRWVLAHYGLDLTKTWVVRRHAYVWDGRRKADITSLTLHLERERIDIPGPRFQTPAVGESIQFVHPMTGTEHVLTIQAFEMQEIDTNRFPDPTLEFPNHFAAMSYTLVPELAREAYRLSDCNPGDSPRPRNPAERGRKAMSAGAMGIIGGADGPTQVFVTHGEAAKPRTIQTICSSLHFDAIQAPTAWRLIFREKMMADMDVQLV